MDNCGAAKSRILVVEDDASISDVVCSALSKEGYACTPAFSGTEARMLLDGGFASAGSGANRASFDLVICDLMLPGMSGEDVIALIREQDAATPILVTSAKSGVVDRVELLRAGADDYLVKPFDLDELIARVEALLRRSQHVGAGTGGAMSPACLNEGSSRGQSLESGNARTILRFGAWEADEESRSFTAAGNPVKLTRTEFDILCTLMRRPTKVFTKRELYGLVWHDDTFVEEKTVNTHVSNIRSKLKGTGTEGYIETVWGIGFKLAELDGA
jgi:DNA-binding response OmpR family regulator